jgi:beta-galactosidase/beta-glucuronidase
MGYLPGQPVTADDVGACRIAKMKVTTYLVQRSLLNFSTDNEDRLINAGTSQVSAAALDGKKVIAEAKGASGTTFYIPIKNPKLWSPEDPFLYDLKLNP